MVTQAETVPYEIEGAPIGAAADTATVEKKEAGNLATTSAASQDIEFAPADEPEKSYFSRTSVWLMILFSGLAIGSDG